LRLSGFTDFDRPILLITPFSEELASGHAFCPRRIAELVPSRVYALSGFEFTEYYFVVSEDGRELISIDAGTRPDFARAAYEALRARAPGLPELTTVFITHSHWDHIGGHAYFRSLNPNLRFYARTNYQEELAREFNAPGIFGARFFGERFNLDDVRTFKPDVAIDVPRR
jgi:glyoxylase-like metal-dependent hydrolase (beta-lactamase superfamily II)